LLLFLLIVVPYFEVNNNGINNATVETTLVNQYRTTYAQILGGAAVLFGLYFAWGNLNTAREGQITERFTRAIDQLGSKKIEIRLGAIYALERISNESKKDYWPIMEILAAYIREKSSIQEKRESKDSEEQEEDKPIPSDIRAALDLISKYKHFEIERLDLKNSNLRKGQFSGAHFEYADFSGADLREAKLSCATLSESCFNGAILTKAVIRFTHLEGAELRKVHLEGAELQHSFLNGVNFSEAHLEGANLNNADLGCIKVIIKDRDRPHLSHTDFKGASNSRFKQKHIRQIV
jgi:hypothetical protein